MASKKDHSESMHRTVQFKKVPKTIISRDQFKNERKEKKDPNEYIL